MNGPVANSADADEILFAIASSAAAELDVMNLKSTAGTADLACPAVALEDSPLQFAVGISVQP
jgi:hypothetical protein